jgi:hypothetical protein
MTDEIGIELARLVSPIMTFFFAEAETGDYPYCTYTYSIKELRNKDGVYGIDSDDVELNVVSDKFEESEPKAYEIDAAIRESIDPEKFIVFPTTKRTACSAGVWTTRLQYHIRQIK